MTASQQPPSPQPIPASATVDRLTTAGRTSDDDWKAFFGGYSNIVLVANSEDQRVLDIRDALPEDTLFVFFNKVDRVLDCPFDRDAMIVTRSNQAGSELVYRHLLSRMTEFLPPSRFRGYMGLKAVGFETLDAQTAFAPFPAGSLDLSAFLESFYPMEHSASSGFAVALWLCRHIDGSKITLTGFSGLRGSRWKLFHIHDWTFEQTMLQLFAVRGKLDIDSKTVRNPYQDVLREFSDITVAELNFAATQVLSRRLETTNRHLDKLISITVPLRAIYNAIRGLKRKSRKERILAKRRKQENNGQG